VCAFYIGHQDYLGDDPQLPESESKQLFAEETAAVVDKNLSGDPSDIQPTKDTAELVALLSFAGQEIEARGFLTETTVANDQAGQPVLYYVNAYFPVPADLEDEATDLEDMGELDSALHAKLIVGGREIEFHGVPEINFE